MMTRKEFLYLVGGTVAGVSGALGGLRLKEWLLTRPTSESLIVNDIHSKLNETHLKAIEHPKSLEDLVGIVRRTRRGKDVLCISGSRHAMGGQQFAEGSVFAAKNRSKSFKMAFVIDGKFIS